jgi:integrase
MRRRQKASKKSKKYRYSQGFVREPLSEKEIKALRKAFEKFNQLEVLEYRNKRGKLIWKRKMDTRFKQAVWTAFLIMYDAAARYKEALRVKASLVEDDGWIFIEREKRGESDWVPVTEECIKACKKLMEMNKEKFPKSEYLFPSQKRSKKFKVKCYTSNIIYIAIKKLVELSNVRLVVSPHYLRHTKATEMADDGEDPLTIKYQMGSRYVDSIMPYIWKAKKKKRLERYKQKLDMRNKKFF